MNMLPRRIARQRAPRPRAALPPRRSLHLHRVYLPSQWPTYTPYALACAVQDTLAAPHFAHKASPLARPPAPSVLSFTPAPTYTLGRRQKELGRELEDVLTAPLRIVREPQPVGEEETASFRPEVTHSSRGGLTTYHGPGQLVLWPVLDLRSPLHRPLTVRSYARLLEDTTVAFLRDAFGIEGARDEENPGVWVGARKIAAMGIHLRRHVATLGVAVNLSVPVAGGEEVNPWARFVPCGIEGRGVTSVWEEGGGLVNGEVVARGWVDEFQRRLEG